jgi:hypothetical protein
VIHWPIATAQPESPTMNAIHASQVSPTRKPKQTPSLILIATLSNNTLLCVPSLLHWHLNTLMLWRSHRAREIMEPRMLQRIMSTDSQLGSQLQHPLQQINAAGINLWEDLPQVLCSIHLEVLLVFRELGDAGPGAFRWSTHDAEYADKLVFVGSAGEEGAAGVHFCHDAASGPDVDAGVVGAGAKEDIRGAVPEGYDFVREGVNGDSEGSGETEIRQLELSFEVDEEILGLQIAVQDSIGVAEVNALQELMHKGFDGGRGQCSSLALCVHVLLQVLVHVFEHQHELILGVDNIVKADNVLVLQLLHQGDLSDCCRGCAFFRIEVDFLECYQLSGLSIAAFEDLFKSAQTNNIESKITRTKASL